MDERKRAEAAEAVGDWSGALAAWRRVGGVEGLDRALELAFRHAGKTSPLVRQLAERILAQDPSHAWARARLGVHLSVTGQLDVAVSHLGSAAQALDEPDTWASLGGCYRRLGWERECVDAYRRGVACTPGLPHAYPLLNYLAERAILDQRPVGDFLSESVAGYPLGELLDLALRHRLGQLDREQDLPWCAFDVAMGRFLRNDPANLALFAQDLASAGELALRAAPHTGDRHAISTTARTLGRLKVVDGYQAGVALGLTVLTALHQAEPPGEEEVVGTGADVLVRRLDRALRARNEALLAAIVAVNPQGGEPVPQDFRTADQKMLAAALPTLLEGAVAAAAGALGAPAFLARAAAAAGAAGLLS